MYRPILLILLATSFKFTFFLNQQSQTVPLSPALDFHSRHVFETETSNEYFSNICLSSARIFDFLFLFSSLIFLIYYFLHKRDNQICDKTIIL